MISRKSISRTAWASPEPAYAPSASRPPRTLIRTATTGEPGYEQVFGAGFWDDLHSDPALASSFDGYLARWATVWVPRVRAGHDWARYAHVVDVGGGMGLLLAELLHEAPDARGTIVELPTTAATAASIIPRSEQDEAGSR